MRRSHRAYWVLALFLAIALHLLLLAGMPRPPVVSGDSDGARTVTINLGSPAVDTPRNKIVKPAPEAKTEADPRPPQEAARTSRPPQSSNGDIGKVDDIKAPKKNKTLSKSISQTIEKNIDSSAPTAGGDRTAESSAKQISSYFGALRQWLADHRRYPRRARLRRLEGTAVLEIELTANGQVRTARITRSSGHQRLDNAVREMLDRAQPLPPPPEELDVGGRVITVPVEFSLR